MKSKYYIVASVATLGLAAVAMWAYRKFKVVEHETDTMSEEWLKTAEYNKEGFKDF